LNAVETPPPGLGPAVAASRAPAAEHRKAIVGTVVVPSADKWSVYPAKQRVWSIGIEVRDVGSGANVRPEREAMLKAARRRELDIIVVWRLDRWGRALLDLIGTLQELNDLGVGFASLSEALDLTTASGRALAAMLAVFAEFERDILRPGPRPRALRARCGAMPPPNQSPHDSVSRRC
jgi:hypothetical protein